MSDVELLNQHRGGSETAFADIVRRHLGWVYGVAQRRLRDAQLAEDVAQAVFMLLHRKAPHFAADGAMIRWLHQTAWYATEAAARSERRRRRLETEVAMMNNAAADDGPAHGSEGEDWRELAPLLDELVGKLSQTDREAVLLRYYRDLPFSEIGQQLGTSEEAARKRVARAVEKLRELAKGKGVEISAGVLATGLGQYAHLALPAGLIARATTAACAPAGSALAGGGASILKGMVFMTASTKISVAGLVVVLLLIGGATYVVLAPNGRTVRVAEAVIAKPQAAVAVSGRGYPTLSPYANLRWDGEKPQVMYNGNWYELAALNDIPAADIVAFCRKSYGNIWQKRFGEDLVEVLMTMGKPAGSDVSLRLISLDTKAVTNVPHAAMTEENRQALWNAVNHWSGGGEGQGYPRLAPYSGVRWKAGTPQVQVGADWFELVAINDVPAADIVAYCHTRYKDFWQKRFEEDLVEVFSTMGKPLGDTVKLDLRSADGTSSSIAKAPMTEENRRAIYLAGQARKKAAQ